MTASKTIWPMGAGNETGSTPQLVGSPAVKEFSFWHGTQGEPAACTQNNEWVSPLGIIERNLKHQKGI